MTCLRASHNDFTTSPLETKVLGLPRGTSKGDTWEMMVCHVDGLGGMDEDDEDGDEDEDDEHCALYILL